ncbi:tetratricopeptide repeat protein, partial [bacterium]|nr:tetratricopeptide repeat protein [bacterium]
MAKNRDRSEFVFGEQFEPDVFWEEHGRLILGVTALIIVVGLGLFIWQRRVTALAQQASDQLAAARDVGSLEQVLREHAGDEVGPLASLRVAELLFQQGRWDESERQFETFLREYPNHEFGPSARLGLAAVAESRGNVAAAKDRYNQLTGTVPGNYVALAARAGLARCAAELGQTNDALRAYEELMALAQGSPQRMDAYFRSTVLGRDVPREAAANTATALVPTLADSGRKFPG